MNDLREFEEEAAAFPLGAVDPTEQEEEIEGPDDIETKAQIERGFRSVEAVEAVEGAKLEVRQCQGPGCGEVFRVLQTSKQTYCGDECRRTVEGGPVKSAWTSKGTSFRRKSDPALKEKFVKRLAELHAEGLGAGRIAEVMTKEGMLSPSGVPITTGNVSGYLTKMKSKGTRTAQTTTAEPLPEPEERGPIASASSVNEFILNILDAGCFSDSKKLELIRLSVEE